MHKNTDAQEYGCTRKHAEAHRSTQKNTDAHQRARGRIQTHTEAHRRIRMHPEEREAHQTTSHRRPTNSPTASTHHSAIKGHKRPVKCCYTLYSLRKRPSQRTQRSTPKGTQKNTDAHGSTHKNTDAHGSTHKNTDAQEYGCTRIRMHTEARGSTQKHTEEYGCTPKSTRKNTDAHGSTQKNTDASRRKGSTSNDKPQKAYKQPYSINTSQRYKRT